MRTYVIIGNSYSYLERLVLLHEREREKKKERKYPSADTQTKKHKQNFKQ